MHRWWCYSRSRGSRRCRRTCRSNRESWRQRRRGQGSPGQRAPGRWRRLAESGCQRRSATAPEIHVSRAAIYRTLLTSIRRSTSQPAHRHLACTVYSHDRPNCRIVQSQTGRKNFFTRHTFLYVIAVSSAAIERMVRKRWICLLATKRTKIKSRPNATNSKPHLAPCCRVLPPGELNGMIQKPLDD